MSVALIAQNKAKIPFFLCTNLLLFCKHKQKKSAPDHHQGFALDPLGAFKHPQTSSCVEECYSLFHAFV